MYGGALPLAKSRKTKRKALTKDEYLDEASEQPAKRVKKLKLTRHLKQLVLVQQFKRKFRTWNQSRF